MRIRCGVCGNRYASDASKHFHVATQAICTPCMEPHVKKALSQRLVNPFAPPKYMCEREKMFNGQRWFWWRDAWRPSE